MKKCLNDKSNNEDLYLSRFFPQIEQIRLKNVLKIIPYFSSVSYVIQCEIEKTIYKNK